MELKQKKRQLFSACVLTAVLAMVPGLLTTQNQYLQGAATLYAVVAVSFGLWMLLFAETKELRIDGLNLEYKDYGGSTHKFDLLKTDAVLNGGIRRVLEIKSGKKEVRISSLDFGYEATLRVYEYIKLSNKTSSAIPEGSPPVS
ncbi:hypothetical protein QEH56_23935 [Pelagicoccus enzymogenes]|uniref:hypothetical protein n=1 Tax=Pelagicoccus enzymogenes TaxID=2773457 RepID=UPI00280ED573|nr:hypothetical protein [Pelagicoccus enzymogenes]MDQ8201236.1 hypothetical protein [Pelagicoccus enzymogenes]